MSGFLMRTLQWLVDATGIPVGVKCRDGSEVFLPYWNAGQTRLLKSDGTPWILYDLQEVNPINGAIVQMTDSDYDGTLYVNPATALATLTINLPSDSKSRLGEIRRIAANKAISSLTLQGATTIMGNVGSLAPGDCVSFHKVASNLWYRLT